MLSLKKTEAVSLDIAVLLRKQMLNVRDVFLRPDHHGEQRFRKNNAKLVRLAPSANTP